MGDAIVGSSHFIREKVAYLVRMTGPTRAAFNAWIRLKGLETPGIRIGWQSANALRALAQT